MNSVQDSYLYQKEINEILNSYKYQLILQKSKEDIKIINCFDLHCEERNILSNDRAN